MRSTLQLVLVASALAAAPAWAGESLSCARPTGEALARPAGALLEGSLASGPAAAARPPSPKVQLIYFGAAWCGPCRLQVRAMRELYDSGEPGLLGYEVIFVSRDDDDAAAAAYVAAERMPWRYLPPSAGGTAAQVAALGTGSVPDMVAVDAQGRVLCRAYTPTGRFLGASEVLEAVRRELAVSSR